MPSTISPGPREAVEPEQRRAFKAADVAAALADQGGRCAHCPAAIPPHHADHINPRDLLGPTTRQNLQLLCVPCHEAKTRLDRRNIAKAARIREREDGTRRPRQKIAGRGFPRDPNSWRGPR